MQGTRGSMDEVGVNEKDESKVAMTNVLGSIEIHNKM